MATIRLRVTSASKALSVVGSSVLPLDGIIGSWRMTTIRTFKGHIGIKSFDSRGFKRIPLREIMGIRNTLQHS